MSVNVKKYFPQNPQLSDDAMIDGFRLGSAVFANLRTVAFSLPLSRDQLLFLTPSASELYGEQVDLLALHPNFWLEAIHPEDQPAVWLGLDKLRDADRGELSFTYRLMASNGDTIWVLHRCHLACNEAGVPIRIDCMVTPCPPPAAPQARHEIGNAVFSAAADALLVRDANTLALIDANAAALALLHCGRAELLRHDLADFSARHEGFDARAEAAYVEGARQGRPQRYEWLLAPREGQPRWVEAVTSRLRHGERDCLLTALRDIDVQRHENDRHTLAHELLDRSYDAIGTADPTGQMTSLNASGLRMLGLTADAVADLFMTDLLPAWAQPHFLHTCLPLATKDGLWRGEMALVSAEGRSLPVLLTVLAHKRGRALKGYSLIAQDVAAYKLAEQRYKRDKEALEGDKLLKDKLLENISGGLLGPLEQLRQIVHVLERNPRDIDRALPHMKHAVDQARRLVDAAGEFIRAGAQQDLPPGKS
ncbi:PAS domain-containing protein [Chitinimonas sp.]|uniref:PAS domain-containing protein n=1 Tax=Chitinimonas sp. TaxID=1934313 RepID=UPI0035B29CC8